MSYDLGFFLMFRYNNSIMAKIKKIKSNNANVNLVKNSKIKTVKQIHPALTSEFSKSKTDPTSHIKKQTEVSAPKSFRQMMADITNRLKYFKDGMTIKNALSSSLEEDKKRAKQQLKAFFVKSLQKDVFKFIVKSSGLHIKDKYQVDIQWVSARNLALSDETLTPKEIFVKSTIKTQCSCERFTYWYRYIATQGNFVLGLREHRFPKVRNANLKGVLCKHQIRVMQSIETPSFQKIFARYINNIRIKKQTRIKAKDTLSTIQASSRIKGSDNE